MKRTKILACFQPQIIMELILIMNDILTHLCWNAWGLEQFASVLLTAAKSEPPSNSFLIRLRLVHNNLKINIHTIHIQPN